MKRKASSEEDSQPGSSKRQQTDPPQTFDLPILPPPLVDSATSTSTTTTPASSLPEDNISTNTIGDPITPPSTAAPSTAAATTRRARRFPSDLKTIPCTYPSCPKTFNRPARLAAHLRSHVNDRPHKCPYEGCGKDYLEEKHLAQHIKGTHTHERRYACAEPGCGKAFVTATRLRRHAAVHEGRERFRCRGYEDQGCSETFRKRATLQRHVRVVHLGLKPFVCSVVGEDAGAGGGGTCEAGFDSAGALRRHVEREHGEIKFWCEECGKDDGEGEEEDGEGDGNGGARRVGFRTLSALQAHMRKEHVNCVFCDVRCRSQAELERHVDRYHSGTTLEERKTVQCSWEGCGKRFTRVSNLNVHVRTAHQGLRFVCGQVNTFETPDISDWNWMEEGCGQTFVSRVRLEDHVRYIHLGRKRPPQLYTVKSALPGEADEMSAAVPTRNIPCSVDGCPAKFIRHHDLEKHLQTEHCEMSQDPEDAIDPRLEGEFCVESAVSPVDQQPGFDLEWAEMRRLIDLDALVDVKE
ncbi:hypothetical protein VTK26DRAFT_839 [Humicola hyalothermophila]